MIKDSEFLRKFEDELISKQKFSYEEALSIFEYMWLEGKSLGVLPSKNFLEEIEVDIEIARILNGCLKN